MIFTKRNVTIVAMAVAVATVIIIYAAFDPESAWFPACPVKTITGLDCPGCGSQRALHALLHGEPARAWRLNPMAFLLGPAAAVYVCAEMLRGRYPVFYRKITSPVVTATAIAAIITWTIARNIF